MNIIEEIFKYCVNKGIPFETAEKMVAEYMDAPDIWDRNGLNRLHHYIIGTPDWASMT